MRFSTLGAGLLAASLTFAATGLLAQTTWYVAPPPAGDNGNPGTQAQPFATIDHAIGEASANDTIQVEAGQYPVGATMTIDIPLTLLGAQAGVNPRSDAAGTRAVGNTTGESFLDAAALLEEIFIIDADDVTIDGFYIGGPDLRDVITAPAVTTQSNALVANNIIVRPSPILGSFAVRLNNVEDSVISQNRIDAFGGSNVDGVLTYNNSNNSAITDNEITGTDLADQRTGIYVSLNSNNVTIARNWLHSGVGKHGILLGGSGTPSSPTSVDVLDNVIEEYVQAGIAIRMPNVLIEGNVVTGGFENAINRSAIYIRQNNIENCIVRYNTVYNNDLSGSGRNAAIRVFDYAAGQGNTIEINNNTISGNFSTDHGGGSTGFGMTDSITSTDCSDSPDVRNNWWGHSTGPAVFLIGDGVPGSGYLQSDMDAGGYIDICDNSYQTNGLGDAAGRTAANKQFSFGPWALFQGLRVHVDTGFTSETIPLLNPMVGDDGRYTKHAVRIPGLSQPDILMIQSPEARLTEPEILAVPSAAEFTLVNGATFTGDATVIIEYKDDEVPLGESESGMRLHRWNDVAEEWEEVPDSTVDTAEKTVSGLVSSFSIFGALHVPNTTPTLTITTPTLTGTQGSVVGGDVAIVSDDEDDDGDLAVAVTNLDDFAGTITLVNNAGIVSATAEIPCAADVDTYTITIQVTDSGGLTDEGTFDLIVDANPAPTIGSYANISVEQDSSDTATPSAPPADANDNIATVSVAPETLPGGGTVSVNPITGVVTITTTATTEPDDYTITVTVTDECGAFVTSSFTLTVPAPPTGVDAWMQLDD